jgi:hypothetical protein
MTVGVNKSDPRLRAADITEQEFVGDVEVHPHSGMDFIDAYKDMPWAMLPAQSLIQPRDGYTLHYDPHPRPEPLVFLGCEGDLVGVFEHDNLTIKSEHQGKGLSRELILAGFSQAPWKNMKNRKVTEGGEKALRSAHRFAKESLAELNGE